MDFYKTTDIVLASTLKLEGYDLTQIDIQGNKGTFVFLGVDDTFIENFNLGKCRVEPANFNATIKQLTTSVRRMAHTN